MKKLYIFGVQNFAEMSHYFFSEDSPYTIAGFILDGAYIKEDNFKGLPIIAYEELSTHASPDTADIFVAVGVGKINMQRAEKTRQITADGYHLASFISSQANTPKNFTVQPNTMIMDQVNIHPFVSIGKNTIIWSNSRIALKANIGDHCWVTCATIGDSVEVGDYSFIGLNATISPFVSVGTHNLIGAAALITKDTKDYAVYKGAASKPAKVTSHKIRNIRLIY